MSKRVHAIVLAAGLSTRMGTPKQLLPFRDRTILQNVVDTLLRADLAGIIVVLGHRAGEIQESLRGRPVTFCQNTDYREGMFSSVRCGISSVPHCDNAALVVLGDQPHLDLSVVQALISAYRTGGAGIIVPTVEGKRGHPVLLDLGTYREKILRLSGQQGLKPVVRGHPEDTLELPVEDTGILRDLDTPEDYQAELKRANQSSSPRPTDPD